MRTIFIFIALVFLSIVSAQAKYPTNFDQAAFQTLLDRTIQTGRHQHLDSFDWRVLERTTPADTSIDHQIDYYSAVGGLDHLGKFGVFEVQVHTEIWTKNAEGNWDIEQWQWVSSNQGELRDVDHWLVAETPSGTVLGFQQLNFGAPNNEVELDRWNTKLTEWFTTTP